MRGFKRLSCIFLLLAACGLGLIAYTAAPTDAATPIPAGLTDPTAKVWTRMEYPAELRLIVIDAIWRAYPNDHPAEGTIEQRLAFAHGHLATHIKALVRADLQKHGTIAEGDSIAEKEVLTNARINALMAEVDQHVTFTSGP